MRHWLYALRAMHLPPHMRQPHHKHCLSLIIILYYLVQLLRALIWVSPLTLFLLCWKNVQLQLLPTTSLHKDGWILVTLEWNMLHLLRNRSNSVQSFDYLWLLWAVSWRSKELVEQTVPGILYASWYHTVSSSINMHADTGACSTIGWITIASNYSCMVTKYWSLQ